MTADVKNKFIQYSRWARQREEYPPLLSRDEDGGEASLDFLSCSPMVRPLRIPRTIDCREEEGTRQRASDCCIESRCVWREREVRSRPNPSFA